MTSFGRCKDERGLTCEGMRSPESKGSELFRPVDGRHGQLPHDPQLTKMVGPPKVQNWFIFWLGGARHEIDGAGFLVH